MGRVELPFIGAGETEGECERRLEGREEELRGGARRPRHTRRRQLEARRGVRPGRRRMATHGKNAPQGGFRSGGARA
jgi:hypothetical protein